jgi:hypothetical protein
MCPAAYVLLRDKIEQLLHFFFGVKGSCGSFHEGCHRSPSGKAQTSDSKGICVIPREESFTPRKNLEKKLGMRRRHSYFVYGCIARRTKI